MDSFEWNKIAGGVLAALLLMMVGGTISGTLFSHPHQEKPSIAIDGCTETPERNCGATEGPTTPTKEVPLPNLLAAAAAMPDISAKGAAIFKQCTSCHTIEKGGKNGTGPNLWGVAGNHHAHMAGFPYSAAIAGMAGKQWDWNALNQWIKNPKEHAPGNKMSFGGIGNAEKRAQLLVYLNLQSDSPMALPAPVAEAAPADAGKEDAKKDAAKTADAAGAAKSADAAPAAKK